MPRCLFNKLVGVAVGCQIVVNAGTFCFLCFWVIFRNIIDPAFGVNAGVCDELKSMKHLMMASEVRWRYLCLANK